MCRTYDPIQYAHADILQQSDDVQEIRCNVLLDGLTEGEYTSDFVCIKTDGDMAYRIIRLQRFIIAYVPQMNLCSFVIAKHIQISTVIQNATSFSKLSLPQNSPPAIELTFPNVQFTGFPVYLL